MQIGLIQYDMLITAVYTVLSTYRAAKANITEFDLYVFF
jgi:hypothetical protein